MENFESLVSVAPWEFIFTICNLLILTWAVKHFLFNRVNQVLEERRAQVETTYAEADEAKTSAEQMKQEYETRMASAKEEAASLVKEATQRAQDRSDEILGAARAEASAMKAKAESDIAAERRKAAGELKNEISGIALSIAGKVVEKEIDADTHQALIDDFIAHLGDAS